MRNLADKIDNTSTLPAAEFNSSIMQELENAVSDTGITLDGPSGPDTDPEMLSQAITRAAQGANRYQDSGSANTYTLAAVRAFKQPSAYIDGMTVVFKVGTTNTGASTINVSSIGSKSLVSAAGAALTGGELVTDKYAMATYDAGSDKFELVLENVESQVSILEKSISQASHGFSVGDVVRLSGTSYTEAQADSAANAQVVGIVSAVADTDNFTLSTGGHITGLSGLTAGTLYYLDPTTAGAITATEPSTDGQVSKPVLIADTTTSGYLINPRGIVVGEGVSPIAVYVQFDASSGTPSINEDENVASITDNGTGDFTINYDVTMSATNHGVLATTGEEGGGSGDEQIASVSATTTTSARIFTATGTGSAQDLANNTLVALGATV